MNHIFNTRSIRSYTWHSHSRMNHIFNPRRHVHRNTMSLRYPFGGGPISLTPTSNIPRSMFLHRPKHWLGLVPRSLFPLGVPRRLRLNSFDPFDTRWFFNWFHLEVLFTFSFIFNRHWRHPRRERQRWSNWSQSIKQTPTIHIFSGLALTSRCPCRPSCSVIQHLLHHVVSAASSTFSAHSCSSTPLHRRLSPVLKLHGQLKITLGS